MKKFVIAAAAALTAVSLTGCSGDTEVNDNVQQTTQAVQTADTAVTEPLIVIEDPGDQPAVSTDSVQQTVTQAPESSAEGFVELTEEPSEDSTSSQAAPQETAKFTYKASSSKWSEDYSDATGASITYRDVDIENAKGTCTVVINYREDQQANVTPLSELADRALAEKGMTDTLEITSQGETTFNNYDAYSVSGRYTIKDVDFNVTLDVISEDENVLEVWTMSYTGCTEAMQSNFSEVLSTVNFK